MDQLLYRPGPLPNISIVEDLRGVLRIEVLVHPLDDPSPNCLVRHLLGPTGGQIQLRVAPQHPGYGIREAVSVYLGRFI